MRAPPSQETAENQGSFPGGQKEAAREEAPRDGSTKGDPTQGGRHFPPRPQATSRPVRRPLPARSLALAGELPRRCNTLLPGSCLWSAARPGPPAAAHRCQDLVGEALRSPDPAPCASPTPPRARPRRWRRRPGAGLRQVAGRLGLRPSPAAPAPLPAPPPAALALPAGPAEAACALCQRAPREPVRADCGHRFCRACVVRFWAEEDGPFPCPECADDCWQRAVEPGRPPLSRRLLALEEAAAAPARDGPASEAALQLLCRADAGPLCAACRMAAGPEPPEWEPRWRKALRGKENKGSVEIMRKDLNDARDLHGQAESAAAVWKGHVMDRRKKALTDYKKLRAFFVEEEEHFLQEAEKEEGLPEDELADPTERFRSLLQAVSELEKKHRNLGLSMLLQ
ncbi:E3 ubiquitin-protein ligase RNF187 [Hylobates moloch]|uniref:E3 ubiquitin-protein ligase RNF187 n=1 Tax=Hylobates moloch TaxID=81572 RepID=UPI002676E4D4|nr:E3 ubiquitin-protein ligase RNF187 [Hylobates moloch]